jgi:hypothetical protein
METTEKRRGWSGNTDDTLESGGMLGAKWWTVGDKLLCLFQREFETKYGPGYEFMLVSPTSLTVSEDQYGALTKKGDGKQRQLTRFAIPPLAGFTMAIQNMESKGFPGFQFRDRVTIECVDIQRSDNPDYSDMPKFVITVDDRR